MIKMDDVMKQVYAHAEDAYPEECCGLVSAAGHVIRTENVASDPLRSFRIPDIDFVRFSGGAMFAYHSHPDGKAIFSDGDQTFHTQTLLPLMVVAWPSGEVRMLGDPGRRSNLTGRPFIYGVYDCYSLARDFYLREFGIMVPQITRPRYGWWLDGDKDPFTEGITACGMVDCENVEYGDVLLFSFGGCPVAHHIGMYLGENQFLHHGLLAMSGCTDYNGRYQDATVRTLRHVSRS